MARYATIEVLLILTVGTLGTGIVAWLLGWWCVIPAIVSMALLSFYRDPPRRVPDDPYVIVAPADGRVVEIEGGTGDRPLRVMIFLSVLNVHINRSPCAGRVTRIEYRPGKFLNALRSASSHENESNTLMIEPNAPLPGPVRVRQIAGVLARRIVCGVREGDVLSAGDRFGMIKLGSRTEVTLPADQRWEPAVRVGQAVRAGRTILCRFGAERQCHDGAE